MPSIQSTLMSQPLPLSDAFAGSHTKPHAPADDQVKAAKDFESVFTTMLLNEMRKTLEPGSLFGEDSGDVYGGLFDQFLGQHIADAGGLGLARMVSEALNRKPEERSLPAMMSAVKVDAAKPDMPKSETAKPVETKPAAAKL